MRRASLSVAVGEVDGGRLGDASFFFENVAAAGHDLADGKAASSHPERLERVTLALLSGAMEAECKERYLSRDSHNTGLPSGRCAPERRRAGRRRKDCAGLHRRTKEALLLLHRGHLSSSLLSLLCCFSLKILAIVR